MAKPKGPKKIGRFVRTLEATDTAMATEARKRNIAVPTLIAELLESIYGRPESSKLTSETKFTPLPQTRKLPERREIRSVKPLERTLVKPNFKKPS
jgi:hypothetical protein